MRALPRLVLLALVLLPATLAATEPVAVDEEGFFADAPDGWRVERPDDGVVLLTHSAEKRATIRVDATDVRASMTEDDAFKLVRSGIEGGESEIVQRSSGRFLRADKSIARENEKLKGRLYAALRNHRLYTLVLTTPEARFEEDARAIDALVASARFAPPVKKPSKPPEPPPPPPPSPKPAPPSEPPAPVASPTIARAPKPEPPKPEPPKPEPKPEPVPAPPAPVASPTAAPVASPAVAEKKRVSTENVLGSMRTLVSRSSEYDPDIWAAVHLVDGTALRGWCSSPQSRPPHRFVFALTRQVDLARVTFDNACSDFEDAAARDVVVEVSTAGPQEGFREVLKTALAKGKNDQSFDLTPIAARWLRLTIVANHGHPTLTELMEIRAYGLETDVKPNEEPSPELVIDRLRVSRSKNGEAATPPTFAPGETVWVNWKPRGLRVDPSGECSFEADLVIESKDHKPLVARPKVVDFKRALPKAPFFTPFVANDIHLPSGFPPGDYEARVTLRDRLSGAETTARASFAVSAK